LPPVVSRSSTQNVTSASGVPRSSKLRCTGAWDRGAGTAEPP
jgi:hypothetical protein